VTCKPEAVIFDLYETLITHYDPDRSPGPSVAEQLGLDAADFARAWKDTYDRRNSGELPDYRSALREAICSLGCVPDESALIRLDEAHTAGHARLFVEIEDHILEMLTALQADSVKLGLISNTTPEEVTGWDRCYLAPHFDDVVFSYQVGLVKPDRRIYELACERLEVSPTATAFVGDGGDGELTGAAEVGLTAWWAVWFLKRWPNWETRFARPGLQRFQQLRSPSDVMRLVVAHPGSGCR
jgi:putative hydrolase of the HAD superfamily